MSEHTEQQALFHWAKVMEPALPELRLLFAIPNGMVRRGHMQDAGIQPGVPDIFLPVARYGYHGLFIELKTVEGKLRETQKVWNLALRAQGYEVVVCYGWDEARYMIEHYLREA